MPAYRVPLIMYEDWPDGKRRIDSPRGRWKNIVLADLNENPWLEVVGDVLLDAKNISRL